jgi:uncharacterized protein YjiS (DUF1127 family)
MSLFLDAGRVTGAGTPTGLAGWIVAYSKRRRKRREYQQTCAELRRLPDWVLHDIGVGRSEIGGFVAELQQNGSGRAGYSWKR